MPAVPRRHCRKCAPLSAPSALSSSPARRLVIIGGGPAGLAAAAEGQRLGLDTLVVEATGTLGGLARTESHEGNRFDVGPHRFFTSNREVNALFQRVCGEDLVRVNRLTRIFYKGKFFNYPLTPVNALFGIGLIPGIGLFASYLAARLKGRFRPRPIVNLEDWVVDRFGRRLYRAFFKTYTEKVWGIPCTAISAEWAGQRIKGLSLWQAVRHALFGAGQKKLKTLVDEFFYPRLGAGQFYEKLAAGITAAGADIRLQTACTRLLHAGGRITGMEVRRPTGEYQIADGDFFLSSAPLTVMLRQFDPPPPPAVQQAAAQLRYRHHISVQLVMAGRAPFPDNWIYVHSPDVRMARVTNYRNFSPAMAGGPDIHPLTAEYFCFADDPLWTMDDAQLLSLAVRELTAMGLAQDCDCRGGYVIRSHNAYPVIAQGYEDHIAVIRTWLDGFSNFLPIGRSGMFKYNNQDHALYTGILAARTAAGPRRYDPWLVNIDAAYHEAGTLEPLTAVTDVRSASAQ